MTDGAYRDDRDAAHARVAELERELADERARAAASPEARARRAAMIVRRDEIDRSIEQAGARARIIVRRVAVVAAVLTALFTLGIASLGASGHPFNAFAMGALVSAIAIFAANLLARGPVAEARFERTQIDAQLRSLGDAAPVRIATTVEGVEEEGVEAEAAVVTDRVGKYR